MSVEIQHDPQRSVEYVSAIEMNLSDRVINLADQGPSRKEKVDARKWKVEFLNQRVLVESYSLLSPLSPLPSLHSALSTPLSPLREACRCSSVHGALPSKSKAFAYLRVARESSSAEGVVFEQMVGFLENRGWWELAITVSHSTR
jgi:hypothetical protein